MPLYELSPEGINAVPLTTFASERMRERTNLQARLRDHIEVIAPGCYVLSEEFGEWEDSRRRIDLLCLDKSANLVVVELKRTEDGGAMELQALRYAAMVSTMTFAQAVGAHARYLAHRGIERDAEKAVLEFLERDSSEEVTLGDDVKILLIAADFSRELTTSVMWLNDRELNIRCVQLRPYNHDGRILLDVQQVLPLRAAEDYQVRVRQKEREERMVRESGRDYTKYDVTLDEVVHERLAKRGAILAVVRHLCGKGRTPGEILEVIPWRRTKFWWTVDGEVDARAFREIAAQDARSLDRAFDPARWFCEEEELIHSKGKTYALSNQWGAQTEDAINRLIRKFPADGVRISAAQ